MNKEQQHIDDFFRNRLKGDELPLTGDEWGKIFDELHPPQKKRGLAWWWLGGAVFCALLSYGLYVGLTTSKTKTTKQDISSSTILQKTGSDKNTELNLTTKSSISQTTEQKEIAILWKSRLPKATSESETNSLIKATTSSNSGDIINGKTIEDLSVPVRTNLAIDIPISKKMVIPYLVVQFNSNNFLATLPSNVPQIEVITSPNLPKNETYIRFSSSILGNNQSLRSTSETDWLSYRNNAEKNAIGWQSELSLGKKLYNYEYSGGLSIQQSFVSYGNPKKLTYQLYDSIPVYDSSGNLVTHLKYNYRDTSSTNGIVNQSYTFVGLPLKIGKEFPITNQLAFRPMLTLRPGFLLNVKGTMINENLQPSAMDINQFNRFVLQGALDFGLVYTINYQWDLNLDATLQMDVTDGLKSPQISQRFTNYGTTLGLTYKLFK